MVCSLRGVLNTAYLCIRSQTCSATNNSIQDGADIQGLGAQQRGDRHGAGVLALRAYLAAAQPLHRLRAGIGGGSGRAGPAAVVQRAHPCARAASGTALYYNFEYFFAYVLSFKDSHESKSCSIQALLAFWLAIIREVEVLVELGAIALEQRGSADRHTPLVALEAVKCVSMNFLQVSEAVVIRGY